VGQPQEVHIRKLQEIYWSDADPDGRGFVPLADALRKAGDFREAHRVLREGLGRHPEFLSGHVVAAWVSVDQGDFQDAESQFRTALELDPHNISVLRGLAEILLDRGEVGSALGLLEALQREDPIDLDLPNRVVALRAQVEAPTETIPNEDLETKPTIWDDPDAVSEELDWDAAALQPDSSPGGVPEGSDEVAPSAPVVEDGEPIPAPEELDHALVTSTLGEIYLQQGLFGQAEGVFKILLGEDPENENLKHRLEEVQSLLQSHGTKPGASEESLAVEEEIVPISSLGPDDEQDLPAQDVPADEGPPEGIVPIEGLSPVEAVSIEFLAPDRVRPVHPVEPTPDEVLSIAALALDEPLSIDALALDEPLSIDALAPDESLSIDALAPDESLSIDALAPDEALSIDALAPDEPLSIDALAPDGPPPDEDGSGRDPTIDAFENWLDKL